MNTEDFDEAIRKKLESLNQPYTNTEIDKVYHHVQHKRKFPFKGSSGSWLLYSLSAAAFTVVTILTVTHFQNNKQIVFSKHDTSQRAIINSADSTLMPDKKSTTITYKSAENKAVVLPQTQQEIATVPVSKPEIKMASQDAKMNKTEKDEQNKVSQITNQEGKESVIGLGKEVSPTPDIPKETTAEFIANKSINIVKPDSVIDRETLTNTQLPKASNAVVPVKITGNLVEDNQQVKTKSPDTLHAEKSAEVIKSSDSVFNNNGLKLRAGSDFQFSNQSFGMGLTGEVLFSNHFSLETGIIYRMYQAKQFPDKDAFFMIQHHDFNHGIDNHFQGKDHIRDVMIQNRTLEIPLTIKYYVPMKKNFGVYFSLGTNLDIYLNQKLSYTYRADSGRVDNDNFKSKGNVVPFNNLVISTGLEKQWKSLSVQIQPYIAPRLKEVFYKPKELEFGVGVGIKYSFGK